MNLKCCSKLLLIAAILFASGCSVMRFSQELPADKEVRPETVQHWHHTMLNGIVEISEPANLYRDCGGKQWKEATVAFRAKNGLVASGANVVLDALLFNSDLLAFYSPWNVEILCTK